MEDIFETTDDDDADELPKLTRDAAAKNGAPKKDPTAQKESERRKKALITLGKAKGFLTTDEVHEHLPAGGMSPVQMDDWLSAFSDEGIEYRRLAEGQVGQRSQRSQGSGRRPRRPRRAERDEVEIVDAVEAKKDEDEPEEDADDSAAPVDPVRMYLRKMGLVALLTREQEVAIAKRVEEGERRILGAVLGNTASVAEGLVVQLRSAAWRAARSACAIWSPISMRSRPTSTRRGTSSASSAT